MLAVLMASAYISSVCTALVFIFESSLRKLDGNQQMHAHSCI